MTFCMNYYELQCRRRTTRGYSTATLLFLLHYFYEDDFTGSRHILEHFPHASVRKPHLPRPNPEPQTLNPVFPPS